jgi:hypothetical protein
MKNLNKVLFAAAIAATVSFANNASAQSKPTGDDRIAASPKVRAMLNERALATRITPPQPTIVITYQAAGPDGLAASPKVRQMRADRMVVVSQTPATEVASVTYRPAAADGIAASPRLRQQLNERSTRIMIAPLK